MDNKEIVLTLEKMHPAAVCELHFDTPFQLLVAVILSAQCTDKRVNEVTSVLFRKYNSPKDFAFLEQEVLEKEIKSCGYYRAKAKHIIATAQAILFDYGGEVPQTQEELMKLPGVGRKTANVVFAVAFGGDAIPVDTHVFRTSHRLGLSDASTPEGVERDLNNAFPQDVWSHLHHLLIHHGRYTCKALSPKCEECLLANDCKHFSSIRREK